MSSSLKESVLLILIAVFSVCNRISANTQQATLIPKTQLVDPVLFNVTCQHQNVVWNGPPTCSEAHCARRIVDDVFTPQDVEGLLAIAKKGMAMRPALGGPTILDINTGYLRDTKGLVNLFTNENDVFTSDEFAHYGRVINRLRNEVASTFGISDLFFTSPTFITRLSGNSSWQPDGIHDEYWHHHVDGQNTPHYHYSGLLYLSTYKDDFEGGRFIFEDENGNAQQIVEPRSGRILLFTAGPENPHRVEMVTSGNRFVLSFWFTCNQDRMFEIFLDGKKHTHFSRKIKQHMQQQQQRQQEQQKQRQEKQRTEL